LAEDGAIPARYQLTETRSSDSIQRTEWNVRDSDGTVIFSSGPTIAGGSKRTLEFALQYQKPCLHLSGERDGNSAAKKFSAFLREHQIKTLNVAGPRQSAEPEVVHFTRQTLEKAYL